MAPMYIETNCIKIILSEMKKINDINIIMFIFLLSVYSNTLNTKVKTFNIS